MRARNIKPGFFKNEDLADCDPMARLLFIGLWCLADREGRLEYRPKRIKIEVFPYDNVNVVKLIDQLAVKKFILIYSVNDNKYIQIINFIKHQNCHIKEVSSTIQAPCLSGAENVLSTIQSAPLTESPLPITESPLLIKEYTDEFLTFWKEYPNKVEKKYAYKCWGKSNGNRPPLEKILEAINKQKQWREDAENGEFRPLWKNPATWINRECWNDEIDVTRNTKKTDFDDLLERMR